MKILLMLTIVIVCLIFPIVGHVLTIGILLYVVSFCLKVDKFNKENRCGCKN